MADVCRQLGVSEASLYNWHKKYGNLGLSEVREVRQLLSTVCKLGQRHHLLWLLPLRQ